MNDTKSIDKSNYALTVKELIEHLQTNFKSTDKLCFWYEGGAYMNCENVPNDWLKEKRMFVYVKDDKERRMKDYKDSKEKVDEDYEFVDDNDVLIY